ncbi:unnamed protein product [Effrenium voratum]|nr:unnamed protein product [Effrenium voratum]
MAWRFPVSAWLVLIGQLLASHGVVLQEAALRGNPVKKVIEMLETMQRKVKSEAAEKEKAFNKYICYCKSTTTTLNSQLAQAEQALPQLQSRVQEVAALQGSLESELAQHKKDGVEAQKAIASASELRQKEAQAFLKDSESQKESVDSVAAAIRALEQGQAESFLQTGSAAVLRRLSLSADMTTRDRDLLSSFLATDSSQPSGSQILGMLKQMKEEMSSSLNEMMGAEQQRIVEHQSLMEAKQKQQQVAMKAMEEKMLRLGELKVETQVLKGDLKDQTEGQKENQQFASDLDKTCSDKQQAWSRYQASEAEELRALSETVQLLSKDEVREKVQAAIYLQRPRRTQSVPAQGWISFLQTQSDEAEAGI